VFREQKVRPTYLLPVVRAKMSGIRPTTHQAHTLYVFI